MTNDEVEYMLRILASGVINDKSQAAILKQCWSLDKAKFLKDV